MSNICHLQIHRLGPCAQCLFAVFLREVSVTLRMRVIDCKQAQFAALAASRPGAAAGAERVSGRRGARELFQVP